MFVVLLTYKAAIAEIDAHLAAHREWLDAGIAEGKLLIAGRQVPRTGGVFLVRGTDRAEAEAWVRTDPFAVADVADYRLIEFEPAKIAPGLEALAP